MVSYSPVIIPVLFFLLFIVDNAYALVAKPANRLLQLAAQASAVPLLGVHDALSARIFAQEGFPALFLSGFGVSSCYLGQPDAGILTYSECEDVARQVMRAIQPTGVPLMVDGDTGYGGASNIRRAVRGLAQAGAAAITIEDQVFPKKCTYLAGNAIRVEERTQALTRIRTALVAQQEAREVDGNDILLVGRTDCRAALGFQEALARCLAMEELGCDIVYAENLQTSEEYRELRTALKPSTLTMLAQVQTGDPQQRLYSLDEVSDLGYNFALMGITGLQATVAALQNVARELHERSNGLHVSECDLASFANVKDVLGFADLDAFEQQFK